MLDVNAEPVRLQYPIAKESGAAGRGACMDRWLADP